MRAYQLLYCSVKQVVIIDEDFQAVAGGDGVPEVSKDSFDLDRAAFMLYTSGTTLAMSVKLEGTFADRLNTGSGRPKGVVMTHKSLTAQAKSMTECWHWKEDDKVLHVVSVCEIVLIRADLLFQLPLHHIHGVSNVLLTALYNGATVEFMPKFDAPGIWKRWQAEAQDLTLFMAVPTIYSRLIEVFDSMTPGEQQGARRSCSQFRLMVSGSAPLPSPLKEKWKQVSGGQVLLERYGMTETGMILSCGMPEEHRVDGHVGMPMPGVSVRLWDSETGKDVTEELETPGEVQIKGDLVFKGYWRLPDKTKEEFTEDGWFKSGDIGIRTKDTGFFRIQGRSSVDSIKSGAEKVSALEVESGILSFLPYVKEVAVVGVPDEKWGQVVAAVIVLKDKKMEMDIKKLRDDLRQQMANYKIPQKLKVMEEIPRNQMLKINKKELVRIAFPVE